MIEYEFVERQEWKPYKLEVDAVLKKVQKELRNNKILTFESNLIGSAKRNLITRVVNGNKGFDFDYNIVIQKLKNKEYEKPKKLNQLFMDLFNKYFDDSYEYSKDSTSVITIKKLNKNRTKIIFSIDFAIVRYRFDDDGNELQEYIRFDKKSNRHNWSLRGDSINHRQIEDLIKDDKCWNEFKELYLERKNNEPNKKSRIVYYQTLEAFYFKNFQ